MHGSKCHILYIVIDETTKFIYHTCVANHGLIMQEKPLCVVVRRHLLVCKSCMGHNSIINPWKKGGVQASVCFSKIWCKQGEDT